MRSLITFFLIGLMTALVPIKARAQDLLVFSAVSLKEALEEVSAVWHAQTGQGITLSFAGSSTLARQIQAGAPADIFLSANEAWMDVLEEDDLLRPGTRYDLLGNALALIAFDETTLAPEPTDPNALAALLGEERLAMALVDAVPAGIYGKAALQSLEWWEGVSRRVAQADNVRAALALVATGEALLGIVYATDALAEPRAHEIMRFPEGSHPPIRYPLAITAESAASSAAEFAEFLSGSEASGIFRKHGFVPVEQEAE